MNSCFRRNVIWDTHKFLGSGLHRNDEGRRNDAGSQFRTPMDSGFLPRLAQGRLRRNDEILLYTIVP